MGHAVVPRGLADAGTRGDRCHRLVELLLELHRPEQALRGNLDARALRDGSDMLLGESNLISDLRN